MFMGSLNMSLLFYLFTVKAKYVGPLKITFDQVPIIDFSKQFWNLHAKTDMENVRNFTQAGYFISRFYPKVRELHQLQKRDKTG